MDLLFRLTGDPTSAASAFGSVEGALRTMGQALAQFAKDSVKEYAESERAMRQLQRVAGDLTGAFKAQASALQESLGVSDDMVVQMQTMLLRFGEAPERVDATVRALLDYSAATGTDALAATQKLVVSVESGRSAFKELGIQYELTGKASADIEKLTASLAAKVGGAAGADADTLSGRTRKAAEAWGDLQKAFGAFLDTAERRTGAIGAVTQSIGFLTDHLREAVGLALTVGSAGIIPGASVVQGVLGEEKPSLFGGSRTLHGRAAGIIGFADRSTTAGRRAAASAGGPASPEASPEASKLREGDYVDAYGEYQRELRDAMLAGIEMKWDAADAAEARRNDAYLRDIKSAAGTLTAVAAPEWEQAGATIGGAFADALAEGIEALATGGELDVGEQVGNVLATILAVAGAVIGTAVGGPVGTAVGGTIGGLAGSAVRGATRRRKHDGGWVERFHDGGWPALGPDEVPIIAQTGEAVLSRRDVARMGGPRGVEAATQGGVTVNISTMDARGTREFFERDGGRALFNALRFGRGSLRLAFGG